LSASSSRRPQPGGRGDEAVAFHPGATVSTLLLPPNRTSSGPVDDCLPKGSHLAEPLMFPISLFSSRPFKFSEGVDRSPWWRDVVRAFFPVQAKGATIAKYASPSGSG